MSTNKAYLEINHSSRIPKYQQIVDGITEQIRSGRLLHSDRIPSINEMSEICLLSRDTVEKAYMVLKEQQVIVPVRGKGFYISQTHMSEKKKVLFLINKASTYKMRIYNSFAQTLADKASIDLFVYHCEPKVFVDILSNKTEGYDQYIIMPHFRGADSKHMGCTDEVLKILDKIDSDKIIIMDRNLKFFTDSVGRVYQDFTNDIYAALTDALEKIQNYRKLILVYPSKSLYPYPKGIVIGFKRFCIHYDIDYEVIDEIYENMEFITKDLYVVIEESDLVSLVKQARESNFTLGEDIGIISYNDTPLKELLGISVVSTDFKKMGQHAAQMILEKELKTIKNDFQFIDRFSV